MVERGVRAVPIHRRVLVPGQDGTDVLLRATVNPTVKSATPAGAYEKV